MRYSRSSWTGWKRSGSTWCVSINLSCNCSYANVLRMSQTKNIPKPDMALPSEDSTCAICDDAEGENSNAIVFCDGCNLAVHQGLTTSSVWDETCSYGFRLLRRAIYSRRSMALQEMHGVSGEPCRELTMLAKDGMLTNEHQSCILCPNEGGAFKQTTNGEWAHLLCAIWVPETRVANDTLMEPITGVDRINKQRWKLVRYLVDRVMLLLIEDFRNAHYAGHRKALVYNAVNRHAS